MLLPCSLKDTTEGYDDVPGSASELTLSDCNIVTRGMKRVFARFVKEKWWYLCRCNYNVAGRDCGRVFHSLH